MRLEAPASPGRHNHNKNPRRQPSQIQTSSKYLSQYPALGLDATKRRAALDPIPKGREQPNISPCASTFTQQPKKKLDKGSEKGYFKRKSMRTLRITKKHINFLKLIAAGLSNGSAFIEAGFVAKSWHSAESRGSQILQTIERHEDYREIIKAFNPTHEMSMGLAGLRKHPDGKVSLGAHALVGKFLGWSQDIIQANLGFQVLITGREKVEVGSSQEPAQIQAPKKPTSLLK